MAVLLANLQFLKSILMAMDDCTEVARFCTYCNELGNRVLIFIAYLEAKRHLGFCDCYEKFSSFEVVKYLI